MANILEITNGLFDSATTVAGVVDKYTTKQAELSTQTKQTKLQNDVIDLMDQLKRTGDSEKWETDVNTFFDTVKKGMGNKESPYYCANNLQADMFQSLLERSRTGVNEKLKQMLYTNDMEKAYVNYADTEVNAKKLYAGQEYINYMNDYAQKMADAGYASPAKLSELKDRNYRTAYITAITQGFSTSLEDAIKSGTSKELLFEQVKKQAADLMGTDINGLPKDFDTDFFDEQAKKTCFSDYVAKQQDLWNKTEMNFANYYDNMLDQRTAEGYNNIALQARTYIDSVKNTGYASPEQISKWTKVFQLIDEAVLDKKFGNGGGSGGSKKPDKKYEDLFKYEGDTCVDIWEKGKHGNMYDITGMMGEFWTREWWNPIYQENYNLSESELEKTFGAKYAGKTSQNNIVDAVFNKFIGKFPEIKELVKDNFKNLRNDMQKHPEQYGTQDVEKMGYFLLDAIYSADPNTKTEDILKMFDEYKNNCYLSRVKYIELNKEDTWFKKKGELAAKFDATKSSDIAQAAKLAKENDYVYTWEGKEYWADGKKEALEAPGGIVDVLKTAVIGTMDIPQSDVDAGKVGFKYVQTKDDMTSQPIITYAGHEYEVIPDDDGKNFSIQEVTIDKDGNYVPTGNVTKGKIGGRTKENRIEAKNKAGENLKNAHSNTTNIENERAEETNRLISESKEMPKAMKKAGSVTSSEWENSDLSNKQIYLQDTESAIDKEANKIKKGKKDAMTEEQFKAEYGIDYNEWIKTSQINKRFDLILKSN